MNLSQLLQFLQPIQNLLMNLALGAVLSGILGAFYAQYGRSLSNRRTLALVLPPLTLITLLVISVIKSSLALSLGLVGALSIVRFRTAIKDPEELVFLFFAIAIGLGLGAEQTLVTVVSFLALLVLLIIRALPLWWHRSPQSTFIDIHLSKQASKELRVETISGLLWEAASRVRLQRADHSESGDLHLTYQVYSDTKAIEGLVEILRVGLPGGNFSVVDQINPLGGNSA